MQVGAPPYIQEEAMNEIKHPDSYFEKVVLTDAEYVAYYVVNHDPMHMNLRRVNAQIVANEPRVPYEPSMLSKEADGELWYAWLLVSEFTVLDSDYSMTEVLNEIYDGAHPLC